MLRLNTISGRDFVALSKNNQLLFIGSEEDYEETVPVNIALLNKYCYDTIIFSIHKFKNSLQMSLPTRDGALVGTPTYIFLPAAANEGCRWFLFPRIIFKRYYFYIIIIVLLFFLLFFKG